MLFFIICYLFLFSCEFVFELGNERTHCLLWVLKFDFLIYFNSYLCGSCKTHVEKKITYNMLLFSVKFEFIDFFSTSNLLTFFPHLAKLKLNLYKENINLFYFLFHLKNIF